MENQKPEIYTEDKISTMIKAYQEVQSTITRYENNLNSVEHKISEIIRNEHARHEEKINLIHEEMNSVKKTISDDILKAVISIQLLITSINERINRAANIAKGVGILIGVLGALIQFGIIHITFGTKKP